MPSIYNSLTGDAAGTDLVGSNKGGAGGAQFTGVGTGGTLTQVNDETGFTHGTKAVRAVATTANGGAYMSYLLAAAGATARAKYECEVDGMPSSGLSVLGFYNGTTRLASLDFTPLSGILRVVPRNGASSAGTNLGTSTGAIPADATTLRVEARIVRDGTNGELHYAVWAGPDNTGTPIASGSFTGVHTGTAGNVTSIRAGVKCATTTATGVMHLQQLRADDSAAAAFIGPETTPTVFSAGPDQSVEPLTVVTLAGTATGAAPTSWPWTQISGPAVTLTGSGPNRTFTAPADKDGATLVFDLGGDQVTVVVLPQTHWHVGASGVLVPRTPIQLVRP